MNIICPQCQFTRQVPADKLPKASTMATCPQCQCRFQVHIDEDQNQAEVPPAEAIAAARPSPVKPDAPESLDAVSSTPQSTEEMHPPSEPKPVVKYSAPKDADTHTAREAYTRQQQVSEKEKARAEAAYDKAQEDAAFAAFAVDNPWENPEKVGYFSAFYQTVLRVLFAAPRFFAGLIPEASQKRALVFFVIVGLLQITFERFWGDIISEALAPTAADDPQLQAMLSLLTPQSSYSLALLLGGALSIVELFFSTTIYFLLFRLIAPAQANFNLIFQVVAYGSAPMLLCLVPALGSVVGFVWSIACTAVGCRYAMRLSWGQTLFGVLPVYVIGLPLILQFLFTG